MLKKNVFTNYLCLSINQNCKHFRISFKIKKDLKIVWNVNSVTVGGSKLLSGPVHTTVGL